LEQSDRPYRIRGFTRDPSKPASQELAAQGVELVTIDLVPESKEDVQKAFKGADIAFVHGITSTKEKEYAQAKLLLDAVKAANVPRVINSGMHSISELSGGKYLDAYHFDVKADATKYAKEIGLSVVDVQCGSYMTNFISFHPPRKVGDTNTFAIYLPEPPKTVLPLIDTRADYGLFVRKAIEHPGETEICTYSELISLERIAEQLGEITGKKIVYVQIPGEKLEQGIIGAGMPASAAKMLSQMHLTFGEVGYYGDADLTHTHDNLARKPHTWAEFVKANDWSKILA